MHLFPQKSSATVQKRNPDSTAEDCIPNSQMSNSRDVQWTNCFDQWKPCDLFSLWHLLFTHCDLVQLFVLLFTVVCPPQIPMLLRIETMIVLFSVLSDHSAEPTEDARTDLGICNGAEDLLWCCCLHWNWPHQSLAVSKIQRLGPHLPASLAAKRHWDWTSQHVQQGLRP